MVFETCQNNRN